MKWNKTQNQILKKISHGLCLGLVLSTEAGLGTPVTHGLVMNRYLCYGVMEAAHPRSATTTSPPPPLTGAEACHCAYHYVVEGWMLWIWTVCKEKKTVLAITKVFQKRLNWTKPLMLISSLHFTFSLAVQFDDLVHSVFHIGLHMEAIPKRVRYVCNSCVFCLCTWE